MGRKRNKNKQNNDEPQPNDSSGGTGNSVFETGMVICDVSPVYGRYLKAKTDIPKGELIIKEKCTVAGPKQNFRPICLGCHASINPLSAKATCSKCSWPLCTQNCEKSVFHKNECSFFKKKDIKPIHDDYGNKDYGAITALRCLLLKVYEPHKWKKFIRLESHNKLRVDLPVWEDNAVAVHTILDKWDLKDLFTEEEIYTVCGIFEVNAFEMGDFSSYGGIFVTPSMLAHDCVPNACHNENMDDHTLEIHAMSDIPAGSVITLCYDASLKGTQLRQKKLWDSKYFECSCKRCLDPTELGTNFSTLMCPPCKKGLLTYCKSENEWKCNRCPKKTSDKDVAAILRKYDIDPHALPTITVKEQFLTEIKGIFHPNHYIPLGVKFNLCLACGRDEGYNLHELNVAAIHRKHELCNEVLKVLNTLAPGLSIARGNILYELQAAEALVSRNLIESGKCSKAIVRRRLMQNTLKSLTEAIEIFDLHYPMRMLATSAKASTLVELKGWINSLK